MAICFADSIFLYNFAPNKEQNPAKRAGRGAWMVVQAEITPVEPDSDNADVGKYTFVSLRAPDHRCAFFVDAASLFIKPYWGNDLK